MAALVQTAANVGIGGSNTQISRAQAGEAVTQGNSVYLKTSDKKYWKADADTAAEAVVAGMVMTPAGADGWFVLATDGPVITGGTMTVGVDYYLHTGAGGMGLIGELTTGDFATRLGKAITTTVLDLDIDVATVAIA